MPCIISVIQALQFQVGKQQLQVRDDYCDVPVLKNDFGEPVGEIKDHCFISIDEFFRYITKHTKSTQTKLWAVGKISALKVWTSAVGILYAPQRDYFKGRKFRGYKLSRSPTFKIKFRGD